MTVLLHKRTTDKDLKIGQLVAHQDKEGGYTLSNKIAGIYEYEGRIVYNIIGHGDYLAEELKLIDGWVKSSF